MPSLGFVPINRLISCDSHSENLSRPYEAEYSTYAKALEGCTLYKSKTMRDDLSNIYFVVPETYFVSVITITEQYLEVVYDRFLGYVKPSSVIISTFIPIVRTLEDVTCDIKTTSGTQIWSQPSDISGKTYTTIPAGTVGINYIAAAYGDIPAGGESNLWYYVTYTPSTNSTNVYEGYVYSENITNLSEIMANTENNPDTNLGGDGESQNSPLYISPTIKTIIIALIAVPIILFIAIILYKMVKKAKESTNKHNFINKHRHFVHEDESQTEYGNRYVSPLQNKLDRMRNMTQIKRISDDGDFGRNSSYSDSNKNYPKFPTYSSDDDLL